MKTTNPAIPTTINMARQNSTNSISKLIFIISLFIINYSLLIAQQTDSITDIRDGQKYPVVKIGTQWWMQKNLNTDKYLNGELIPNITDNTSWYSLTTGGRCYYNNDSAGYAPTYGSLYNWFTVVNAQGLCPLSWHVPSEAEFSTLFNYLGGENVAGGKMKQTGTALWFDPNVGATNESDFTLLPGGLRGNIGSFGTKGGNAYLWSVNERSDDNAFALRPIFYASAAMVQSASSYKVEGYNIRCLSNQVSFGYLKLTDSNLVGINNINFIGPSGQKNLILINQGTDTVIISGVYTNLSEYSFNLSPASIIPGDSVHFTLWYNAPAKGIYTDTLFIRSNDPYDTLKKIPLLGIWTNPICGVIPADSVLTKAGSPYFITPTNQFCNGLGIDKGVTLTIEPGVTIFLDSMAQIIVDGRLIANGTEAEPISFIREGDDMFNQIYFRSADSSSLRHVIIKGGNKGIYAENTTLAISTSSMAGCGTGVELNNSFATIDSSSIQNNSGSGIFVHGTSSGGNIISCSINKNGSNGITGGSDFKSGSIIDNIVNGNNGFGINASVTITGNEVRDNLGTGISGTGIITGNTIENNTGNGIAGSGIIQNNSVTGNQDWGFSGSGTVSNNDFNDNSLGGIYGSSLTLSGNRINGNKGPGISASSSTIKFNQIKNNTGNGITSTGKDTIIANLISGNAADGINEGTSCIIKNNDIYGNTGDGIETSALPTVNYNNIYGNDGFGLKATKQSTDTINAWNNYWGSNNITAIQNDIYDYYDDMVTVKVRFGGYKSDEIALKPVENLKATTFSGGRVLFTWDMHPKAYQYYLYNDNQTGRLDSLNAWVILDSSKTYLTQTLPDGDYVFGIRPVAYNNMTGNITSIQGLADGTEPILLNALGEAEDSVVNVTLSETIIQSTGQALNNWTIDQGLVIRNIISPNYPDAWITKSPMPIERRLFTTSVIDGKIYAIGGMNVYGNLSTVLEYDPLSNTWLSKSPMSIPRYLLTSAVVNGKIYAIGGYTGSISSKVEEYNPVTDTWVTKSPMPTARGGISSAVINGKIYVIGGGTNVEEYDPETDSWTIKSPMLIGGANFTSAMVNGKIYAIGLGSTYSEVEEYDPETDIWLTKSSIPIGRTELTSSVVDGKIYIIGGYTSDETGISPVNIVDEYDPIKEVWKTVAPMPTKRGSLSSAVVNEKIYVIGGSNSLNNLSTVEEFNPIKNTVLYLENDLPSPSTPITLTCNKISDIYGNTSGPQTITFYTDDGNKNPIASLAPTPGELSDDITFHYTLTDFEKDILKLKAEYSSDGGNTWHLASITGDTINLDSTKYSGNLLWHSYTDLPGLEKVNIRFKITPRDADPHSAGTSAITNKLVIDNNLNPITTLQPVTGEVKDTVDISFTLSDAENNNLLIRPEYYDSNLKIWKRATIVGDTAGFVPGAYILKWLSKIDLPMGATVVPFLIRPYDNEYGNSDTINLVLDNIGVCSVQLTNTIPAETSGDIVFNYLISDDEGDVIYLDVKYSKDNGANWLVPSTTGTLTGLNPSQYSGSFTWHTVNNFNGTDFTNVKWSITPHDANPGIKAEGTVHIDNNLPPALILQDVNGLRRGDITLHYTLTDNEGNNLSLAAKVIVDGQWINCTLIGKTSNIAPAYYTGTITWNSSTDIPDADGSYKLALIPMDNDAGTADTITINLNNMSIINLGGSSAICSGHTRVLDAGGGYKSYLWSTDATSQSINVTTPGTYWVKATDNNDKTHYCDTITILVNPLPVPNLGNDVNLCQGQQTTLYPGSFIAYNWNTGYPGNSLSIDSIGNYTVTVTDVNGCQNSDTAYVFVQSPFSSETLAMVTVDNTAKRNVLVWQATPNMGTAFYKIYREESGSGFSNVATVAFNNPGVYIDTTSFPDQLKYNYKLSLVDTCGHESALSASHGTLYLKVNKGSSGYDLQWTSYEGINITGYEIWRGTDPNNLEKIQETAQSITNWSDVSSPPCAVYYMVKAKLPLDYTLPSSSYNSIVSNISSNGAMPAEPIIYGTSEICEGETSTLDAGNFASYIWSTGKTTQTVSISASGNYKVTVTNQFGCNGVSDTFYLKVNSLPVFDLGNDTLVCGTGPVSLKGPTGYTAYHWSNGMNQKDITAALDGNYTLTVTDANNCSSSDVIMVNHATLPVIKLDSIIWICIDETTDLDPGLYKSYQWNTGATSRILTVNIPGTYTVTITNVNGCQNTGESLVKNHNNPNVTLGPDIAICQDSSYIFDAGNYTSYLWSNGKTTQTIQPNIQGSYWVKISDMYGCNWNSDTVQLTVNSLPAINLGKDTSVCGSQSFPINAQSGYKTYKWDDGSAQNDRTITATGLYKLTVTDNNGCKNSDEILVTFNNLPVINLNTQEFICGDVSANLDPGAYKSYIWSTGSTNRILPVSVAGTYKVTVTDVNNCTNNAEVLVSEKGMPDVSLGADKYLCTNDSVELFTSASFASYLWSDGSTGSSLKVDHPGEYMVMATDIFKCSSSDTINIIAAPDAAPVNLGNDISTCKGSSVNLDAGAGYVAYLWNTGATSQTLQVHATGSYSVIVSNDKDCKESDQINVNIVEPFVEKICVVTVDTSGKNLVAWQRTPDVGIVSYNIYKETNTAGDYTKIGSLDISEISVFTDVSSQPKTRSERYKLTTVDTCGNESAYSPTHKTIHLTVSLGLENQFNLVWDNYEGIEFGSYIIFRGTSKDNLQPIDTIPNNIMTYTDNPVEAGTYYYQIAVMLPEVCIPTLYKASSGPFATAVSNKESKIKGATGISDESISRNILIYPNPASDYIIIELLNINYQLLQIINPEGRIVYENSEGLNKLEIKTNEFSEGIYLIKLFTNQREVTRKFVIIK